ncbi:hypothetical protein KKG19_04710, partial [Patescibacteria group bacterium]|nr:hypothetical protein [Patescibacteria group bacterium]
QFYCLSINCLAPYLSGDEAWLQFPGFLGANTQRYRHVPGIQNLMITGRDQTKRSEPGFVGFLGIGLI